MHKILMEENYTLTIESQWRLNPKMKVVVKAEVLKFLDSSVINPIFDNLWLSLVQVV